MSQFPLAAKVFIVSSVLAGAAVFAYGLVHLEPSAPLPLAILLLVAVAASRLKVSLPGVNGTMSVNLPFFLVVVAQVSTPEALLAAFLGSLAQSLSRSSRNKPVQLLFNSALLINAVGMAAVTFTAARHSHFAAPLAVIAATVAYFVANTIPFSMVLWLAEGEELLPTWRRIAGLTLPYYLLSGSLAAIVCAGVKNPMWTVALALLAVMYLTFRSYRLYFSRFASGSKPTENTL